MFRRISLFLLVNLGVLLTISIVTSALGIGQYLTPYGLDISSLLLFCLAWGMIGSFISLQISRWMAKMTYSVELQTSGDVFDAVKKLTRDAGLPMPEVGIYRSPDPNAFATGPSPSRALVAVSTGLLDHLDSREVEAVLAHEVAHIRNGDMVTMALLQGVINAFVMFLARVLAYALSAGRDREGSASMNFLLVMAFEIAFSILGSVVLMWFSRQREFRADAGSAQLRGARPMIAALHALESAHGIDPRGTSFHAMMIRGEGGILGLLRSHPTVAARVAALEKLAK